MAKKKGARTPKDMREDVLSALWLAAAVLQLSESQWVIVPRQALSVLSLCAMDGVPPEHLTGMNHAAK